MWTYFDVILQTYKFKLHGSAILQLYVDYCLIAYVSKLFESLGSATIFVINFNHQFIYHSAHMINKLCSKIYFYLIHLATLATADITADCWTPSVSHITVKWLFDACPRPWKTDNVAKCKMKMEKAALYVYRRITLRAYGLYGLWREGGWHCRWFYMGS